MAVERSPRLGQSGAVPRAVTIVGVVLVALASAAAAVGAIARAERSPRAWRSLASLRAMAPALGRRGYVGSGSCAPCHPGEHASWAGTFHRTMTQLASPEVALAPFDGRELVGADGVYRPLRRGDELWVEMVDPEWKLARARAGEALVAGPTALRRVVMTTGSHHMQVYWVASAEGRELHAFPFTYLIEEGRWVPNEATLLRPPEGDAVYTWNAVCVQCHAVAGVPGYEGGAAVGSRVAELGIACEACHGPGEAHARHHRDPKARYRERLAAGGDPTIVNPARLDPRRASEVCGLCHSAAVFADEAAWLRGGARFRPGDALEPEHRLVRHPLRATLPWIDERLAEDPGFVEGRLWPDGSIKIAGRELTGLVESACYQRGELSCLSCHRLHGADPNDQLAPGMDGDAACTGCHAAIGGAIEAHTHHPAGSQGSRCYECHMPRTTYGLLGAIRSHTIDVPDAGSGVDARPNACNLCHLDRTLAWTSEHLERWYGAPKAALEGEESTVSAGVLWALRGDASQRALIAWHMGWEGAHAAAGARWEAPFLALLLEDPYDAVRIIAARSLGRLPGGDGSAVDPLASASARAEAAASLWARWQAEAPGAANEALLVGPGGVLDRERVDEVRSRRNDRPIDLRE